MTKEASNPIIAIHTATLGLLALLLLGFTAARASEVCIRLSDRSDDPVVDEYRNNPSGFPVCRTKMDYLTFLGPVISASSSTDGNLFNTNNATIEFSRGEINTPGHIGDFTGNEVVAEIKKYEDQGWEVKTVLIYREDWLHRGGNGGPFAEDIRTLSPTDLANVRAAIQASTLRCKSTVKLLQLLGGSSANRDTWHQVKNNPALLNHLRNFDGLGVECHVGDHLDANGRSTLDAMAQVTQWVLAQDRPGHPGESMQGFVFMGGTTGSYIQYTSCVDTYNYLWNLMTPLGVAKNDPDLIYMRQGARYSANAHQVPENSNTLTKQMAWLIGQVSTSNYPTMTGIADREVEQNQSTGPISFTVGGTGSLSLSAVSYNTTVIPTANIVFGGSGANRTVTVTPAANKSGTAIIKVAVSNGALDASDTFVLTVNNGGQPPTITAIPNQMVAEGTSTAAIPFDIADSDTPVASLTVTATSSNTGLVPISEILFGGSGANRTITLTPAVGQLGTTDITLQVSDGLLTTSTSFTLTVGRFLFSEATDAGVRDDLAILEATKETTWTGSGGTPSVDRCTVYVFQLPDLGAISNPFLSSSFTFNYDSKINTVPNIDLYGLGRRDSANVLSSNYYGQTTTEDPAQGTIRLQTNILTNATQLGLVGTSSGANAELASYLNAQYASGAGIGKYVFLRLNSTVPKSGANRAYFTMSEGDVATRPRITYTANSAPTISSVVDATTTQDSTTEIPFTIDDVETDAAGLTVTATSSNTALVPNAGIVIGGADNERTATITPAAGQMGTTLITLQVSDGTRSTSTSFTLTVFRVMYGSTSDAEVQKTLSTPEFNILSQTGVTLVIGTAGGGGAGKDRCAVLPFQLPNLGSLSNPFTAATFTVNYEYKENNPIGNVSVYGLGSRSAPTILTTDYWAATPNVDPTDATLLQTILIADQSSDFGLKTTHATGNANLLAYLNAQYAGGTGAGKYVFLRLASDTPQTGGTNRYRITSADGASSATNNTLWPQIGYTAIIDTPPTISGFTDQSIAVNTNTGAIPFTIGDGQTAPASLTLAKASSNPALVPAANIVFGGSGANPTVTVTPVANQLGTSTITVTVSDGSLTTIETFVLTVTGNGIETWRFTHFNTTANTGTAADGFDFNSDSESNLLEFATGQNPKSATTTSTQFVRNGANLEFTYTRSKAAMADGILFTVECSDTLGAWSDTDVTEQILTDNGSVQTVKATCPAGTGDERFIHLKVTRP